MARGRWRARTACGSRWSRPCRRAPMAVRCRANSCARSPDRTRRPSCAAAPRGTCCTRCAGPRPRNRRACTRALGSKTPAGASSRWPASGARRSDCAPVARHMIWPFGQSGALDARAPVSLALQGGGAHGAFTWGVLDALLERGLQRVVALSGASAGAVNALLLAQGLLERGSEGARETLARFWQSQGQALPWDAWGLVGDDGQSLSPLAKWFMRWA